MNHPTIPIDEPTIERLLQDHVASVYGISPGRAALWCRRHRDGKADEYGALIEILPNQELELSEGPE